MAGSFRSICASARDLNITRVGTLSGQHQQASTGRVFRYWLKYGPVNETEVFFACAVGEPSRGAFGSLERGASLDGTVSVGPTCVPVELAICSRVMSYIEHTDFGEWKPPPPSWPGWYGPYL